jgi:predicted transcriptional regulator
MAITTLTLRISPTLNKGLRQLAEKYHRSLSSMLKAMIPDVFKLQDIAIPEQLPLRRGSISQNYKD